MHKDLVYVIFAINFTITKKKQKYVVAMYQKFGCVANVNIVMKIKRKQTNAVKRRGIQRGVFMKSEPLIGKMQDISEVNALVWKTGQEFCTMEDIKFAVEYLKDLINSKDGNYIAKGNVFGYINEAFEDVIEQ